MTMVDLPAPTSDEAAGLKLLSKKDRERSHPAAQVQKLRRIAVRALAKADWFEELRGNFERNLADPDFYDDVDEVTAAAYRREARVEVERLVADQPPLREKARVALEAAVYLNAVHNLGYPIQRRTTR